jgi:hypothetical protein
MNILTKATVLVLNRNWQAINVRTPREAFCIMATNVATGLEIEGEDHIRPVTWEEWITLPIREQDESVHTVRGEIRVPAVIVRLGDFLRLAMVAGVAQRRRINQVNMPRCERGERLLGMTRRVFPQQFHVIHRRHLPINVRPH